ncbi:thiol-disulfide isomerase/thioredoxin [Chitinophaga terrae (ex Kim and Jung 2007)]|uniref:peroxiredoxin family protein n=1 Tax=Chitinophaga terrae (ex Kim and Jung 2007) TaxID=408074 RepID=UPI00277FE350|nr:TlpA disulfide reductase family protein [Chitinophaga terrae (ex Kim and Jung 2007)]MDQ0108728.1 thiol-disulfide isomerase/thioredoxin [Chitinophaga terrae (ex Kim and Jung 2007)]
MRLRILLLFLLISSSLAVQAGGKPARIELQISRRDNNMYPIRVSFYKGNDEYYDKMEMWPITQSVEVKRYELPALTQVVWIADKALLVTAGEQLTVKLKYQSVPAGGFYVVSEVQNPAKQLLPFKIDSLLGRVPDSLALNDVLNRLADREQQIDKLLAGTALLPAERDMLQTYAATRHLKFMADYLSLHPAAAGDSAFVKRYFGKFRIQDPVISGIGNKGELMSVVQCWRMGLALKEGSGILQDYEKLLTTAGSNELKQVACMSWVQGELRANYFSGNIRKLIPVMLQKLPASSTKKAIAELYKSYSTLDKGRVAYNFTINSEGRNVRLSDFRGKLVVIDFWATWCTYCKAKLPRYREIKEQFAGKPGIVFLTVSMDDIGEAELWKQLSEKFQITGPDNLLMNTALAETTKIREQYKLTGVPRYILIDENGKFLNSSLSIALGDEVVEEITRCYNERFPAAVTATR